VTNIALGELRHHFFVVQHRTRDQVRKIGNKQCIVNKVEFLHLALIGIHQKGDLRESKKGNAERENDFAQSATKCPRSGSDYRQRNWHI
jgi:hypothetical protein